MGILQFLSFQKRPDNQKQSSNEIGKKDSDSTELFQAINFKENLPKHILYQRMLRERYEKKYELSKGEYENAD